MKRKILFHVVLVWVFFTYTIISCDFFRSKILILTFSIITPLIISAFGFLLFKNHHIKRKKKVNYILLIVFFILFSISGFKILSRNLLAVDISFYIDTTSNNATIIIDNNLLYIHGPINKTSLGDLFFISRKIFSDYEYSLHDFQVESISDGVIEIKAWNNLIIYNKFDNFIINNKHYYIPRKKIFEFTNTQPFLEISKGKVLRR
jgi:hypothetical protein